MKLILDEIDLTNEIWGTEVSAIGNDALEVSIMTPVKIDVVNGRTRVLSINGIDHSIIDKEFSKLAYVQNCWKYTFYAHSDFDQDGLDSFLDYEDQP